MCRQKISWPLFDGFGCLRRSLRVCQSLSSSSFLYSTVILKLTLRHKTDSTDCAAADCADFASACRFRSFRRFYVGFFPNFPVMLIVLDH